MSQNELQRLLPSHYQIVELCLAGYGTKEIAQVVGQTPQNISLVTKSPMFQDELARRRMNVEKKVDQEMASTLGKAKAILENAAEQAAATHVNGLHSNDEKIRHSSAEAILNRTMGKGEESRQPTVVINVESLNVLQTALMESDADRLAKLIPATVEVRV